MSKTPLQLSEDVENALCTILEAEGEVVTKWVAVADVIGPDGKRWLRTFWPDGLAHWDANGMLTTAMDDFVPAEES